jgi:APA family basic amino acid/polyamine antiporter
MEEKKGELIRELGLKEGLAIGLGTMIGAGIFVLPAIAVERAGQAAALSYLIAGLICLPVAMIVSELATGMPRAGGSYTFITQALGPLAGSVVGPANWLGLTFANGFYLIATGQYLALFIPIPPWIGAVVSGLLFTLLNYRGAKISGSVQHLVVVVLVAILILFVVVGMLQGPEIPREAFPLHGWGAVVGTVGLIIVSFTGFEKVSTIAEEIKNPGRNLPLAIVSSVAIATVLYVLIVLIAAGLVAPTEINLEKGLLVEAAGRAVGPIGETVMVVAALLATLSSANAATMASSRISYGMGRDRVLPGWFGYAHPRFNTPSNGILFTGGDWAGRDAGRNIECAVHGLLCPAMRFGRRDAWCQASLVPAVVPRAALSSTPDGDRTTLPERYPDDGSLLACGRDRAGGAELDLVRRLGT